MMQHDATLTVRWGGVGWDINVLTTTSLILWCQRMFHQLGRPWWCNRMLGWQYVGVGWGEVGWDIKVLTTTSLILRCQRIFHQLGRPWWCNRMLGWQYVGVGWGEILKSSRPRPWYYVVNACSTNWDDLGDATWCYVDSTLGWGWVGYKRPHDHVLDTTLSTHVPPTGTTLLMQHDATLTVRWAGVGWGGVGY